MDFLGGAFDTNVRTKELEGRPVTPSVAVSSTHDVLRLPCG